MIYGRYLYLLSILIHVSRNSGNFACELQRMRIPSEMTLNALQTLSISPVLKGCVSPEIGGSHQRLYRY